MIVNEISLVIQKIFSVKQPKDQRFKVTEINQENDGVTNEMIWSLMKVQKRFQEKKRFVELRDNQSQVTKGFSVFFHQILFIPGIFCHLLDQE